jgi:hypothetical protein
VSQVWVDPICGNGKCESPYEFPAFMHVRTSKLSECFLKLTECSLKLTECSLKLTQGSLKLTECSLMQLGCRTDCGVEPNVLDVVLLLQSDFTLAPAYTSASKAMAAASWNLCLVDEERRDAGMADLCWFDCTLTRSLFSPNSPLNQP